MRQVRTQKRSKWIVTLGAAIAASALLSAFQPASAQVLETSRAFVNFQQALLTGGTSWGQGGPHEHHEHEGFYSGKRAMLRSHQDDAALNDGSEYGSGASLFDSAPGTDDDDPSDWDYLVFGPRNGRRLVLSSDFVDGDAGTQGNQPLVCEEDSYLFFGRFSDDRDWLEELSNVGDSTTGDASFDCWIDDPSSPGAEHQYYEINWYLQAPLRKSGQCVTYSRTDDKTLLFEAPPATVSPLTSLPIPQDDGCPAEVLLVTRTKEDDPQTPSEYTYTRELLGYESAPLQLTVTFTGRFL